MRLSLFNLTALADNFEVETIFIVEQAENKVVEINKKSSFFIVNDFDFCFLNSVDFYGFSMFQYLLLFWCY